MRDFKKRWVDPSFVRPDGTVARLSERDNEYRKDLDTHLTILSDNHMPAEVIALGLEDEWRSYSVVAVDPEVKQILSALVPELM